MPPNNCISLSAWHPASTIKAEPPSLEYPHGHFDPVVINTDQDQAWPSCGISGKCFIIYPNPYQYSRFNASGHVIADLCIVFRIVPSAIYSLDSKLGKKIAGWFLAYVRRYDIVPQQNPAGPGARHGSFPETATGLYLLKRAKHSNGKYMGDIVPLDQVRALVD